MLAGTDPRVEQWWPSRPGTTWPRRCYRATAPCAAAANSPTPAAIADRGDGVFKRSWAATLMSSLLVGDSGSGSGSGLSSGSGSGSAGSTAGCGRMMLALCQAYATVAQTGPAGPDHVRPARPQQPGCRSSRRSRRRPCWCRANRTRCSAWTRRMPTRQQSPAGTTVAVSWYAGGHDGGSPDQATQDRITGWLHHYLFRTGAVPSTAFRYTVSGPVSDTGRARNRTLEVPAYPGLPSAAGLTTPRSPSGWPATRRRRSTHPAGCRRRSRHCPVSARCCPPPRARCPRRYRARQRCSSPHRSEPQR